nr:hypothetical protein [Tanacetum cinerariifolium]
MATTIEQQVALDEALVPSTERTMATTIEQQVALDEALIPSTKRLRIGRSNFRLPSDIKSKEPTLQVVYDVLRGCPFFKAFLPWRSFAAVINKCLTGKSFGFDSFRLSQAQILWGLYHKRNIDYAFLIWEDFVHQVEHNNQKKSNDMYYPRFTKVIIHHFMTKKPSIPRRTKVNWHYVRDDIMFSTIKVVSRHQNTQKYGVILPIELTTEDIRNTKAYKEYYACATGEAAPKPKASARRKSGAKATSPYDPSKVERTEAEQLKILLRRSRQETHISQHGGSSSDGGTGSKPGVPDVPSDDSKEEISWNSSDDEDVDAQDKGRDDNEGKKNDESTDERTGSKPGVPDVPTDESEEELSWNSTNDEGDANEGKDDDGDEEDEGDDDKEGNGDDDDENDDDNEGDDNDADQEVVRDDDKDDDEEGGMMNLMKKHGKRKALILTHKLLKIVKIKAMGRGLQGTLKVEDTHVTLTPVKSDGMESIFETTLQIEVQTPTSAVPLPIKTPTMTSSTIATITQTSQAPTLPTIIPSEVIQHLPSFGSLFCFDDRLRSLEQNFSEVMQTNQFAGTESAIPGIAVNKQLEAEVLTRSSHSSRISYAVAADLSEMELKKILIKKMKGNKSIQRSDEQRNLYKALVDAYESDKIILDTYGETVTLKRRRDDDEDKDEEPSARPDRGSKNAEKASTSEYAFAEEPVQTTFQIEEPSHLEFETGADDQPIVQSFQHPKWFSQPQKPPSLDRDWNKTLPAVHKSIQPWISELAKQADTRSSFNELIDAPLDFSNFIMNRLRVYTLTLELLAGPTYDLMKGSCKSLIEVEYHLEEVYKATTDQLDRVNPEGQQYPHNLLQPLPLIPDNRGRHVIPFAHFINNDFEYLRGGASSWKYTTSVTKTKVADYGHIKWIEDLESAHDVYSKRRIIAITELKIMEWHSYKHLDWVTVRRDDDKIYKFKEGDYKRLHIQDIADMLLLLVQGKLTNLTVEERFTFNVSLRMFTRSIVIQRRVEDLQLGVKSYQKRLNLTKPDTYRSDLKHNEAYTAYSNP